ncbi:hypothetical protein RHSIM_Rhsim13G0110600 [Rhododendron simsii]|uniref:Aminotransferase-like plant mobile domain-containing protein n=1 Tax=Rhododendron simsii TaxID=118357 RepID=A0A834L7U9_RHOSS|nr:hypothetical protein RHSIM_Rhsim13G0110600 [Rhododendron simsii]
MSTQLIGQGKQVHAALARIGYGSDMILKNDLVDLYGKCGRMDMACDVFDKMLETNVVLWTAMMCEHLQQGRTMDLNLNELRSPDPGPRDGSILRLQQHHRSREVWEADRTRPVDSKKVRVRSAKKGIRALPWPSPPVLELIRRARLEGLCSLPFVSVDWGLITALLERWRPETHTFHLRPGESTITLQDVEVLLGIPVEGKAVTGNTNLKARDLCLHLLGEQPTEESDINGMKVKASWLSDRFTGQVEEGADPKVVAHQARGYLLLLMGETIFADHSGGYVHLANLERLENFDEAGTYSWGSGALANLYHNLCHGSKAGTKQITGCFILLQVWAWERLPYLAPGRLGKRAPKAGAPLIGRWDDEFHSPDLATHLVGTYRFATVLLFGRRVIAAVAKYPRPRQLEYKAYSIFVREYGEILGLGENLIWAVHEDSIKWLDALVHNSYIRHTTPVPDFLNARINDLPVKEEFKWLQEEFTEKVHNVSFA